MLIFTSHPILIESLAILCMATLGKPPEYLGVAFAKNGVFNPYFASEMVVEYPPTTASDTSDEAGYVPYTSLNPLGNTKKPLEFSVKHV